MGSGLLSLSNFKKLIVHIFFFLLFAIIIVMVNPVFPFYFSDFIRLVTYMLLAAIALFYIHALVLLPIIVLERDKKKYFSYTLGCVLAFFLIEIWFGASISSLEHISRTLGDSFKTIVILLGMLCLVILFSLVYGYISTRINAKEQSFNLALGTKDAELKLLKSQVNPHFLFNTLNTLYATSLQENATKTAESITQLANLIRYMQEDINKDFIPLEREIKYLQDYVKIQKLRCAIPPQTNMQFKNIDRQVISPGILIPFVENAFKYSTSISGESKLFVSIVCDEHAMYFECRNTYDSDFEVFSKEQSFGIGINNTKKRLQLIYADRHKLKIDKMNNMFTVKVRIDIRKR